MDASQNEFWRLAYDRWQAVVRGEVTAAEALDQVGVVAKAAASPEDVRDHSVQTRAFNLWANTYLSPDALSGVFSRQRTETDVAPYGLFVRDLHLRSLFTLRGNDIIQAAVSAMVQKVQSTPWLLEGPSRTANQSSEMVRRADLGRGWDEFVAKVVQDFLTQDNGMFWEVIWDDASRQDYLLETPGRGSRIIGFAHMDAGRCRRTGDPNHPVIYQSLAGGMHKLHYSRVTYVADMPSPQERLLGRGFCALSRCLSMATALVRYSTYREELLDDLPPLGLLVLQNIGIEFWDTLKKNFSAERLANMQEFYSNFMPLFSMDANKPADAKVIPFKGLWDNFSEKEFQDSAIDIVCMAFGLDRQELAPLATSGLGSGAQSTVLAQKARGKGIGNILTAIERRVNLLLPPSVTFKFDNRDDEQDQLQAVLRQQKAQTIISLSAAQSANPLTGAAGTEPLLTRDEARQLLVHEIPEWSEFIRVADDGESQFVDTDEEALAPVDRDLELAAKALRRYGSPVRLHKSGKREPLPNPLLVQKAKRAVRWQHAH